MEGWNQQNRNVSGIPLMGWNGRNCLAPLESNHAASVFVYHDALWMVAGNNMEHDVWKLERVKGMCHANLILLMCMLAGTASATDLEPKSQTIAQVLREPLPPEDLHCTAEENAVTVQGPTFRYTLDRANGAVTALEALREGKPVVTLNGPAAFTLDDASLAQVTEGLTQVLEEGPQKVVLETRSLWAPGLPCAVRTTIYNDGVLVSQVTLTPEVEVVLRKGIKYEATATGHFSHFLHKRRDTNGLDCFQGALPGPGETARMNTPTSCLEVYSDEAALAIFTDMGDFYRSPDTLDTAAVRVDAVENGPALSTCASISFTRERTVLRTPWQRTAFHFRTGSLCPNRMPHPRRHDLRMFIWVGDEMSLPIRRRNTRRRRPRVHPFSNAPPGPSRCPPSP